MWKSMRWFCVPNKLFMICFYMKRYLLFFAKKQSFFYNRLVQLHVKMFQNNDFGKIWQWGLTWKRRMI